MAENNFYEIGTITFVQKSVIHAIHRTGQVWEKITNEDFTEYNFLFNKQALNLQANVHNWQFLLYIFDRLGG